MTIGLGLSELSAISVFFGSDSMHHHFFIHLRQMDVAGSLTSTENE